MWGDAGCLQRAWSEWAGASSLRSGEMTVIFGWVISRHASQRPCSAAFRCTSETRAFEEWEGGVRRRNVLALFVETVSRSPLFCGCVSVLSPLWLATSTFLFTSTASRAAECCGPCVFRQRARQHGCAQWSCSVTRLGSSLGFHCCLSLCLTCPSVYSQCGQSSTEQLLVLCLHYTYIVAEEHAWTFSMSCIAMTALLLGQ